MESPRTTHHSLSSGLATSAAIAGASERSIQQPTGQQIPIGELATIEYKRQAQVIKSEDTFLTGYVVFDMKAGNAEVDVVEAAQDHLKSRIADGSLTLPSGVSYSFAVSYENQLRS